MITAFAGVLGAAVGGLANFATQLCTQRYLAQRDLMLKDITHREALYSEFIKEAAQQFVQSVDRALDKPSELIALFALFALFALVGRIRLIAAQPVLEAAERIAEAIVESYMRPPMTIEQILQEDKGDPLQDFTLACRAEREMLLRRL